jgi:malate synthase
VTGASAAATPEDADIVSLVFRAAMARLGLARPTAKMTIKHPRSVVPQMFLMRLKSMVLHS